MRGSRKTIASRAAAFAAGCACFLTVAAQAVALNAPGGLSSSPGSPSQSASFTFTWSAPAPDSGFTVTGYQVNVAGAGYTDVGNVTSFPATFAEGSRTFSVRAIETIDVQTDPPVESPVTGQSASIKVVVDQTKPTIDVALSPARPNGLNGWWTSLRVIWTCSDPGGSGIASCAGSPSSPATEIVSAQGANQNRSAAAVDRVGFSSGNKTSPPFHFDGLGPRTGSPSIPSPNARIGSEPTFTFSSGGDATSGADHYDVLASWPGRGEHLIARVPHAPGRSSFSAVRDPLLANNPPFPEGLPITWYVRTFDKAGNSTPSGKRNFTIDSTVPPAPQITAGPNGFTNKNAPGFSWTGTFTSFAWTVTRAGEDAAVQSGSGTGTSVTLAPLTDGDYTFTVTQQTPFGVPSDEATRSFLVDTVAPAAPIITSRPPFPTSSATPAFAWTSEEGASFRWQVIGSGGANVQGPTDTPLAGATITAVGPGAYSFRVSQIDPAGNASAVTSDPFAVVGPAAIVTQKPGSTLPRRNSAKLRPRAGLVLKTRTPRLSWAKGPRGTTLYNLQLFRVVKKPAGKPPVVRKIFTSFPKHTSIRLPRKKVLAGTCYVWRVWPYLGDRFTPQPLGISNFCVAKASVLKKAAARRKARRSR
jgi:hypothetical protein